MKNFIRISVAVVSILLEALIIYGIFIGFDGGPSPSGGTYWYYIQVKPSILLTIVVLGSISGFCVTRSLISIDRGY